MHVRADASSDARLVRMILPGTGQTWTLPDASDGSLTVDGRRRRLGVRADGFVVDATDAASEEAIRSLGMETMVANTIMRKEEDRVALADAVLGFAQRIRDQRLQEA